jgi:predicted ester cyclase
MAAELTRDVVQRFIDAVLNRGNHLVARELLAPGFVDHHGFLGVVAPGGFHETLRLVRDGFPDAYYVLDDLTVDGAKAVANMTFQGTHDGPFRGQAASRRKVTVAGVHVFQVVGARIAEHWAYENLITLAALAPDAPAPAPALTRRLPAAIW